MSLTSWLVDYLFTPLRMATRNAGNVGLVFSITVNMVAIGLWHGFTLGYLVFGVLHSLFLSVDVLTLRYRRKWFKDHLEFDQLGSWLGWLLTFHLVAFALVFFRARSVRDALMLLGKMWSSVRLGWAGFAQLGPQITHAVVLGIVGYLVVELGERFRPDQWAVRRMDSAPRVARWSLYASMCIILIFGVLLLMAGGDGQSNPFVYAIY